MAMLTAATQLLQVSKSCHEKQSSLLALSQINQVVDDVICVKVYNTLGCMHVYMYLIFVKLKL